ncbi:hypothetical protein JCM10212_002881 [Sporobolomyces blumeae]
MATTRFPYSVNAASSSTSSSIALEQANADLLLLQQSLSRSAKISDRMSSVLGELDDRLAKLEKSLVPIYKETGKLTRVSKNLESTMRSLDGLLGHHDLVEREEGLIKSGPKQGDLQPYLAAIDRLVAASEALRKTDAKGQSATLAQMGALIEAGAKQVVAAFARMVKETSPTMDAGSLFDKGKSFPTLTSQFVETALPLLTYLLALPSSLGPKSFADATRTYTEMRGLWIEEGLKNAAKEVLVDAVPGLAGSPASGARSGAVGLGSGPATGERRGLGRLLDVMFALFKSEYAVLGTVFSTLSPSQQAPIYASLLPPALALFAQTASNLNTLIKKSLHSLIPIAFSSFTELQERATEYEDVVRARAARKENEVGDALHSFRGTCLSSLPGMIEDVKSFGTKAPTGTEIASAAVSPVTINVVNFARQLADNQPVVETFLAVLGPGNWGGPKSSAGSAAKDDENGLLPRYLSDLLTTLLHSLEGRARQLRGRQGTSTIYLLNNVSFLRHSILSSQTSDLLGEEFEDVVNKKMRATKSSYLEIWSPLVGSLLDAGLADQSGATSAIKAGIGAVKGAGGTERRDTKDRFVRFHEALDDVEALHGVAKLDHGEVELRERLKGEVERMVVPTYAKFVQRHRKDNYSTKYVKLDAEGLEAKIRSIFD